MEENREIISPSFLTSKLYCLNSKSSKLLCSTQNCFKNALICRNQQCQCLVKSHPYCDLTYTQKLIQKVIQKKGSLTNDMQKALDKIDNVYQEAIQKLSNDRQSLLIWRQNYGLSKQQIDFLTSIKENKVDQLTGDLVWRVKSKISVQQQIQWLTQTWVDEFWEKGKIKFDVMFQKINISSTVKINKYEIQSKILESSQKLLEFFSQQKQEKINKFNLLYRASSNNFSVKKFKQQCSDIPNTLILIRTQFDKIIGGFTPKLWKNIPDQQYVRDDTQESFVFSLSMGEKFQLTDPSNAIKNVPNMGPIFGGSGGWDISIAQNANVNQTSFFNFPSKYNNGKYSNSQSSYTKFCGNSTNYYSKILEWEVFEVQFSQNQNLGRNISSSRGNRWKNKDQAKN